jgi:transposase
MQYEDSSSLSPAAVERVAAAPGLGLARAGLDGAGDRGGVGRDARGRESVAQAGPRGRRRSLAPPTPSGCDAEADAEQRAHLPTLLTYGPEAYGFRGEVWTTKRVAAMIQQEFHVRYHPAHMSRLLRGIGWSVQKPRTRASQRDEAAIEQWVTERWPALQAKR